MEIKDPKLWSAFEKYCEWLSLPRHFHGYMLTDLEEKGFPDELISLLKLRYKSDFGKAYGVSVSMLTDWDKHQDLQNKVKANWKKWCKHLTPSVMGKFYEKLMLEGDAARMKIWLQTIEGEGQEDQKNVNFNIGFENILKAMREDGDIVKKEEPKDDK